MANLVKKKVLRDLETLRGQLDRFHDLLESGDDELARNELRTEWITGMSSILERTRLSGSFSQQNKDKVLAVPVPPAVTEKLNRQQIAAKNEWINQFEQTLASLALTIDDACESMAKWDPSESSPIVLDQSQPQRMYERTKSLETPQDLGETGEHSLAEPEHPSELESQSKPLSISHGEPEHHTFDDVYETCSQIEVVATPARTRAAGMRQSSVLG